MVFRFSFLGVEEYCDTVASLILNRPIYLYTVSRVQACVSSVEAKAEPIIEDIIDTVQKVTDLGSEVAGIVAKCAPSGANFITAIPCIVAEAIKISSKADDDISKIIEDVKDIIDKAPGLKQELDSCYAEVQSASSNIAQLIEEIDKCIEDYTSTAA